MLFRVLQGAKLRNNTQNNSEHESGQYKQGVAYFYPDVGKKKVQSANEILI